MLDKEGAKKDLLSKQTQTFLDTLAKQLKVNAGDLSIKLAGEYEFYIIDDEEDLNDESEKIVHLREILMSKRFENLAIESLEAEDGKNQFEVQFIPTNNPIELANRIVEFKKVIQQLVKCDLQAKPYPDEPGSALHYHISVYYKGENLFSKDHPRDDDEYHYLPLYWCIAGMLEFMLQSMVIFAPTENCYERYLYPRKMQRYIHFPTGVSWGFNNRTCAIRIPKKPTEDPKNCRIEHRVCSTQADPYLSLFCIISAMTFGVKYQLECPEPVYGNSFDAIHDYIKPFPKSLEKAKLLFDEGEFRVLKKLL